MVKTSISQAIGLNCRIVTVPPAVTDLTLLPSSGSGSVPFLPRAVAVAVRAGRSVGESPGQPWQVLDPND